MLTAPAPAPSVPTDAPISLTNEQLADLERGETVVIPATEAQFLAFWPTIRFRADYHNNHIVIMGIASFIHEVLVSNLTILLSRFYTPGQGFFIAGSNVGIKTPTQRKGYYNPDITVVKGRPIFVGGSNAVITNPHILIEILSESTARYDLDEKLPRYRRAESLRAVIFVDHVSRAVSVASATDDPKVWTFTEYDEPNDVVNIEEHAIPLADFWANLPDDVAPAR